MVCISFFLALMFCYCYLHNAFFFFFGLLWIVIPAFFRKTCFSSFSFPYRPLFYTAFSFLTSVSSLHQFLIIKMKVDWIVLLSHISANELHSLSAITPEFLTSALMCSLCQTVDLIVYFGFKNKMGNVFDRTWLECYSFFLRGDF